MTERAGEEYKKEKYGKKANTSLWKKEGREKQTERKQMQLGKEGGREKERWKESQYMGGDKEGKQMGREE